MTRDTYSDIVYTWKLQDQAWLNNLYAAAVLLTAMCAEACLLGFVLVGLFV